MAAMSKPALLWLDVAVVFAFVILGRRTHEEADTISGVLRTAAPFMLGLLAGWTLTNAWRRPADLSIGFGVLAATVAIGMVLRNVVFSEGTAATFIVVASLFLALGFLGWRLAALRLSSRRKASPVAAKDS